MAYGFIDFIIDSGVFAVVPISGGGGVFFCTGACSCRGRSRWLVAQSTWDARRWWRSGTRFRYLLTSDNGIGVRVGFECFRDMVDLREVYVCRDLSFYIVEPDYRGKNGFDMPNISNLDFAYVFELGRVKSCLARGVSLLRDEPAFVVYYAHVFWNKLRHAGGNEVYDADNLGGFESATWIKADEY